MIFSLRFLLYQNPIPRSDLLFQESSIRENVARIESWDCNDALLPMDSLTAAPGDNNKTQKSHMKNSERKKALVF